MGFDRTSLLKTADAGVGSPLCRLLGAWDYLTGSRMPPSSVRGAGVRRIVAIRPGGMGDMLVLYPLLRLLRQSFPDADLDVVCERRNADMLTLTGLDVRTLVYDACPLTFLASLRRRRYDVAVDSEQFHNFSAVFAYLSGASVRIGFNINPRRNALYTHLVSYDPAGNEGDQFMRLLGPLGIEPAPHALEGSLANLQLPAEFAGGTLQRVLAKGAFVAMHAGASTRHKQWRPEAFAALLQALRDRRGLDAVLVGNGRDAGTARRIAAAVSPGDGAIVVCAGDMGLAATAALIRRARLFVGADSGLAHLAAALGIPSVVLFGPSDPGKWGFENATHAVVRQAPACAPCSIFGYHKPCRHVACMRGITVESVLAACAKVLEATPR